MPMSISASMSILPSAATMLPSFICPLVKSILVIENSRVMFLFVATFLSCSRLPESVQSSEHFTLSIIRNSGNSSVSSSITGM